MHDVAVENEETLQAWDGPLFDRFVRFRDILTRGLGAHGNEAIRLAAPQHGERALDVGCGFGETTVELAAKVGVSGRALGVDVSPRFIEVAREEALAVGATNVEFEVSDVQTTPFEQGFELAYSRMGTMFFANPVAAMRNVRAALVPGGRLAMVVWRSKEENEWAYQPQLITERFVTKPEEYDEPTCGPGPFSMANADTVSGVLLSAGFEDVALHRCDLPMRVGADVEEAVAMSMSIGPAGEILRLAGDRAADVREPVAQALREWFSQWDGPEGIVSSSSTWIVTARVPRS
jgi:ubiquinone/menaquinone biosynthesis C-methylase UbiE